MLEVCSTTLPQMIIPEVYADPRYQAWKQERNAFFARRAQQALDILSDCPGVVVNRPNGAFYLSVVFADDVTENHTLRIGDGRVEDIVRRRCPPGIQPDRKFCYELLGAYGLCVVPLSSFVCELRGFRSTLLERDDAVFETTYRTLAEAIREFVSSV